MFTIWTKLAKHMKGTFSKPINVAFSVAYRYIKRLTTRECWVIWHGNKPCASCWCPSQSFIIIKSQKIKSYKSLVVNFTTINIHYDFNQKSNIHWSSINQNKFLKTKSNIHWITDPWKFALRYACIFCMKKKGTKISMSYLRQSVSNSRSGLEITPRANSW